MQTCPIPDFLTKHPLPLHFQMVAISQRMEVGCWDWTQSLYLFKFFQNLTYFAQFGVTGDSFWLHMQSCPIPDFLTKHPPTPPFLNGRHFSTDGGRMLRLDSMSLSFKVLSESYLFCSIWCNRRLVLTYIINPVQFQIFLPNTPHT